MRLVTFDRGGGPRSGILLGDSVVDTRAAAEAAGWAADEIAGLYSNRNLLEMSPDRVSGLAASASDCFKQLEGRRAVFSIDAVKLGPPLPDPQKIVCIGLNYHDHAEEVGAPIPAAPIFFAKYANSLAGPKDDIVPPRDTSKVDYEAELCVIIGSPGRYIDEADALSHVAGAMPFNDVSARDLQMANPLWTGGKAIDTFGPCGPALVTLDEIDDLQNLALRTWRNGKLLQDGNTGNMIFAVARLISFLSRIMTLVPGDLIVTGTPAGVAMAHKPPGFLQTGDLVEVEIEGLGRLQNRVVQAC